MDHTTTKVGVEVDLCPDKEGLLPEQSGHTRSSPGLNYKLQRADREQDYSFARLTMRALFSKHFQIKCIETGEEKRYTDEAESPGVAR